MANFLVLACVTDTISMFETNATSVHKKKKQIFIRNENTGKVSGCFSTDLIEAEQC